MSKTNPSKDISHNGSDGQGTDKNIYYASNNLEASSHNTQENVHVLAEKHVPNSATNYRLDLNAHPNGSDLSILNPGQIYSQLQEKLRTIDDVDDLILSHITNDDINSHSHQLNSHHSNFGENSDKTIPSGKTNAFSYPNLYPSLPLNNVGSSNSYVLPLDNILNQSKSNDSTSKLRSDNNLTDEEASFHMKGFAFNKTNTHTQNTIDDSQHAQMKNKLKTMWNNVKYGWRVKREVNLKLDSMVWLLGQCYHNKLHDSTISQNVANQLKLDILSKVWLTYRINFPMIPGTDLITDSGWGCMLRCGQMMMAQALVCHFLQRDWRLSQDHSLEIRTTHKMILRWFGDSLSDNCPFSLHHLVLFGENYGRKAGDWYGPTHAAQVLRDALIQAKRNTAKLQGLQMYVALDGIVFKQDVMDLCTGPSNLGSKVSSSPKISKNCMADTITEQNFSHASVVPSSSTFKSVDLNYCAPSEMSYSDPCPSYSQFGPPSFGSVEDEWTSLILFVSVRLGNDKINPFYVPCLKSLLAYKNCIGIIGGRPKHALYFIGWQDDKLIHMDPHTCQTSVDVEKGDFSEKTFHTSSVRTISFQEMDPSCAIGFYFSKKQDFEHFVQKFSEITAPMKRNLDYPVFALAEGRRTDIENVDAPPPNYARPSVLCPSSKTDEEDYILL